MNYKKNDIIELMITDVGSEGEGIGRAEASGIPFFVKGAVQGDVIRASVMKLKASYGYARLLEIKTPSKNRTEPRCPLASKCGGCQLQQLNYMSQLEYKNNKVRNCLVRIGGFQYPPMEEISGMENPWYYRNKAQFPVACDNDGTIRIGFYAGHSHTVIDTEHCYIQAEIMQPLVKELRLFLTRNRISIYDEESGKGLVRHILLRVGFATGEVMVCLVLNGSHFTKDRLKEEELRKELTESLLQIFNRNPIGREADIEATAGSENKMPNGFEKPGYRLSSLCINVNRENTNVILGDKIIPIYGNGFITDRIGEVSYRISPLSFYQVNPVQTKVIYDTVKEFAGLTGTETVWDLYCGIGTIGLYLAGSAGHLIGVEIVTEAVEDAKANAALNGISNAEFYAGAAEEIVPQLLENKTSGSRNGETSPAQIAIVDPPRKGCDTGLLEALLKLGPERIVYVSCDPATLARDLKFLCAEDYKLERVKAVDAFCQSIHVECVVWIQLVDKEKNRSI